MAVTNQCTIFELSMSFLCKKCSACFSTELTLVDSSYLGEWAEHIYECETCGHKEIKYFDFVYHLTPIATNLQTNENNTTPNITIQEVIET